MDQKLSIDTLTQKNSDSAMRNEKCRKQLYDVQAFAVFMHKLIDSNDDMYLQNLQEFLQENNRIKLSNTAFEFDPTTREAQILKNALMP